MNANPAKKPPNATKKPDTYKNINDILYEKSLLKNRLLIPCNAVGTQQKSPNIINIYAIVSDILGAPIK